MAIQISLQESRMYSNFADAKTPQQHSKPRPDDLLNSAQRTVVKSLCSSKGRFEGEDDIVSAQCNLIDGATPKTISAESKDVSAHSAVLSAGTATTSNQKKEIVSDSEESSGALHEGDDGDYG